MLLFFKKKERLHNPNRGSGQQKGLRDTNRGSTSTAQTRGRRPKHAGAGLAHARTIIIIGGALLWMELPAVFGLVGGMQARARLAANRGDCCWTRTARWGCPHEMWRFRGEDFDAGDGDGAKRRACS